MADGIKKLRRAITSVAGRKSEKTGEGRPADSQTDPAGAAPKGNEEDLHKLTRLELLEILVEQRKELDMLKERLAETQERLERDDALIRKYLLRESTMTVKRETKHE